MRVRPLALAAVLATAAGCSGNPTGPQAAREPAVQAGSPSLDGAQTLGSGTAGVLSGGTTTASDTTGGGQRGSGGFGSGH